MGDWLVGYFAVFGIQFQTWMLIALLMVVAAVALAVWSK